MASIGLDHTLVETSVRFQLRFLATCSLSTLTHLQAFDKPRVKIRGCLSEIDVNGQKT